jgi:hypothetical protein
MEVTFSSCRLIHDLSTADWGGLFCWTSFACRLWNKILVQHSGTLVVHGLHLDGVESQLLLGLFNQLLNMAKVLDLKTFARNRQAVVILSPRLSLLDLLVAEEIKPHRRRC